MLLTRSSVSDDGACAAGLPPDMGIHVRAATGPSEEEQPERRYRLGFEELGA